MQESFINGVTFLKGSSNQTNDSFCSLQNCLRKIEPENKDLSNEKHLVIFCRKANKNMSTFLRYYITSCSLYYLKFLYKTLNALWLF